VTTVLFLRHGLTALTGPVLTGWTPGVHLDERGRAQVAALGSRLAPVALAAIVSSPLERCLETADAVAAGREPAPERHVDERIGEVRYGAWTGGELKKLAKDPLWATVQAHPSAVTFPDGEALRDTQARAVAAVRDWNNRLGDETTYAIVSHADVIKSILADALGLHLDQFQRIVVGPASSATADSGRTSCGSTTRAGIRSTSSKRRTRRQAGDAGPPSQRHLHDSSDLQLRLT
jgi:probable phosphoglycerate mutase